MNIDNLKKKILYRSEHRGTKEMDLLLSNFVKKYINSLNERELCELESLLNTDDEILYKWYLNQDKNTTPFVKNRSNPGAASTFYFYNPTTVAYGKQEFEQIYGDRKNNDNWRWSSLKSNGFKSNNIANNAIVSNDSLETLQPDYYISKIPKDAVVIDSLVTDRNYAYYQLGLIYKEKFKEYKLSKTKFENLLDNNPEEKLILPSKYNLYKINELLNEGSQMAFYKEDIIKNYPDSRYAKILLNPDDANITDKESPEYLYAQTFKLLDEQKFEEVIEKSDQYSANFSDEPIQPKFELLKALAIGKIKSKEDYKKALEFVVVNYGNTEEGKRAKSILALLIKYSTRDLSSESEVLIWT